MDVFKLTDESKHLNYIRNNLVKDLTAKLQIEIVLECNVERSAGLDGYMSALYSVQLCCIRRGSDEPSQYDLIVKFMKGDHIFRTTSHAYTQFANEVFLYNEILPYYTAVLRTIGTSPPQWTPRVYLAQYGFIDGLSNSPQQQQHLPSYPDAVLVLENLKSKGYRLGYPMHLDHQHLLTMIRPLADYHSLTHVLRLRQDASLQNLIERIIPLQFKDVSSNSGAPAASNSVNFYEVIYRLAFERFFAFFERWKANRIVMGPDDTHLVQNVETLKTKYGDCPIDLLESFRYGAKNDDEYRRFAVILHGDFNRTNVLFQYHEDVPVDAKLIDFQLLRYGSPAIDLSFFLYINVDPALRDELWTKLLEFYHGRMLHSLMATLSCSYGEDGVKHLENRLEQLCFQRFHQHFSKYAFYGAMLCMEVIPWMCGPEEECNRLSFLMENDMLGDEFWKLSMEAGGDDVNWRIFEIIRHCSRMGYMENL